MQSHVCLQCTYFSAIRPLTSRGGQARPETVLRVCCQRGKLSPGAGLAPQWGGRVGPSLCSCSGPCLGLSEARSSRVVVCAVGLGGTRPAAGMGSTVPGVLSSQALETPHPHRRPKPGPPSSHPGPEPPAWLPPETWLPHARLCHQETEAARAPLSTEDCARHACGCRLPTASPSLLLGGGEPVREPKVICPISASGFIHPHPHLCPGGWGAGAQVG